MLHKRLTQRPLTAFLERLPLGVRMAVAFCFFQAVFYVAYFYGMALTPSLSAPFWFPDSVLLTALVCTRRKWWWILLLSTLPIRLFVAVPPGTPTWFLLSAFANDALKAASGAYLVRRFIPDLTKLGNLRESGWFALLVVLLIPALSALAGAASRCFLGYDFGRSWLQWFLGDSLASLVLSYSALHWLAFFTRTSAPTGTRRIVEAGLLCLGLSGMSILAFGGYMGIAGNSTALIYAPVPFLFWAAVRFGPRGAATALSLVACLLIWCAAQGRGLFHTQAMAENILDLQVLLFVVGVPMLFLAAVSEDRARVGEALRSSEERYRAVVESQTELICRYLPDTTLTFVNEAYCRFFGRSREELIGRKFLEFVPASAHETVRRSVAALVEGRRVRTYEHEVVLPQGGAGWQQWVDSVIVDAQGEVEECQGIGRDVTARKTAEDALRVSEERMLLAAEAADLGFWMWDVTSNDIWMTEKRREIGGLERFERVTFQYFLERVHPEDRNGVEATIRRAVDGEDGFENEHRAAMPSGEIRWLASRGRCLRDGEGRVTQIVGVSMDVTARKRTEEGMQSLVHATRLALVGELTASIAHEINQPLGAILSNADAAELLMELASPPLDQVREILADIRKDDLRASEVIRRLRALLRKREMHMQPINLNEVATEALRLVTGDAHRRVVMLATEFSAEPAEIEGDAVHLQQVLLNLILNGMDAMRTTPAAARRLVLSTRRNERGQIEVAVADAGHGIAPEKLGRIFESFFTTKEEGMGLGLAIARSIIETHHGRIWAENNRPGPGATFYFTLPARHEQRSAKA